MAASRPAQFFERRVLPFFVNPLQNFCRFERLEFTSPGGSESEDEELDSLACRDSGTIRKKATRIHANSFTNLSRESGRL
jgi:hypothetical protein